MMGMAPPPLSLPDALEKHRRLQAQLDQLQAEHAQALAAQALSLRDQFAMAALIGLLASDRMVRAEAGASSAYEYADACLVERQRRDR